MNGILREAVLHRQTFRPFAVAGVFTLAVLLAVGTALDLLPHVVVLVGFCGLIFLSYLNTEAIFPVVVSICILVPVDISISGSEVFRIGPTRAVLAAFMFAWLLGTIRRAPCERQPFPMKFPIGLYLVSGLLSITCSVNRLVSINGVIGRDVVEQFLFFYLFVSHMNRPNFFNRLLTAIFVSTAVICILGAVEFTTHVNPLLSVFPEAEGEFREGMYRTRSVFFHPIALGCYINLIIPFIIVKMARTKSVIGRVGLTGLIFAMVCNSFFTVSRAPWVCLVMETMIMMCWWGMRSFKVAVAGFMFLMVLLVSVLVGYQTSPTVARMFNPVFSPQKQEESSSEYYRVILFETVMDHLDGGRWICGYGPNAFYLSGLEAKWDKVQHSLTSADNHYLKLLLEYGSFGLFSFLALMITAAASCIVAIRKTENEYKIVAVACLASVVGFIAVNTTVSMFQMFPLGMVFWMSVAIAISLPGVARIPCRRPTTSECCYRIRLCGK